MIKRFLNDQSGVTAIEYGLIASLLFLAIITGASLFSTNANAMFDKISNAVSNVAG